MDADTEIKATVRERYGAIATAPTGRCGCCGEAGANLVGDMYEGVASHVAEADRPIRCFCSAKTCSMWARAQNRVNSNLPA